MMRSMDKVGVVVLWALMVGPALADYDETIQVVIDMPGPTEVRSGQPAGACIVAPSGTFRADFTITSEQPIAVLSMSVLFGTDLPVWQVVPFGQDQGFTVQTSAGDTLVLFDPPREADPWLLSTFIIPGAGRDKGAIDYLFSVIDAHGNESVPAAVAIGQIDTDCPS
jgi:hypothetical protein